MTDRPSCAIIPSGESGPRAPRFTHSPAYDIVMRLPVLIWSTSLALISLASLQQFVQSADPALPGAAYYVNIAMRLSVIAYLVILTAMVIIRSPPIGKARGAD